MEVHESSSRTQDHLATAAAQRSHQTPTTRTGGITTTRPRETILSKIRDASQYLSDASAASAASAGAIVPQAAAATAAAAVTRHKGRTVNRTPARGYAATPGYTVSSEGRLVFQRLKDEVRFATVTAAVRSVLEHHRGLLRTLGLRKGSEGSSGGGGSGGVRSFVALVCKDAAKAGGYRLCMRYFGSRLPAAVPWAIDALVRGDTLSRGMQEVLQIGGRRAILGVVSSALPIGGLPSFLLIGAGWWAVEKGARSVVRLFADDGDAAGQAQQQRKHKKKEKAKL